MTQAYLELEYARREDGLAVALIATLPTVRAIRIGGAPGDLRLPGVEPDQAFASVSFAYDHFVLETLGGEPVWLNDAQPPDGGARLHDGDAIRIRDYRLTFHEGEPPDDPPLLETHLRWRLRSPTPSADDAAAPIDDASKPYIEEFQLSVRHLLQGERYAELQRMAEGEIKRVLRLEEAEALDGYSKFLWWTRVRMAREVGDLRYIDIAREAIDLHTDFAPLSVACGISFLAGGHWQMARDAFSSALNHARREFLLSVHDARVGRILAEHCLALSPSAAADARRPDSWTPREWDVPEIRLHAPGDELLLWRTVRYGRVFSQTENVRFVYRGLMDGKQSDGEIVQRWEIFDVSRELLRRRRVATPALAIADPSLTLEIGYLREALERNDRGWSQSILDLSQEAEVALGQPQPVGLDDSAIHALSTTLLHVGSCVRIWCTTESRSREQINVTVVARPATDDVVFQQGVVSIAVARPDIPRLAGSQLMHERGRRKNFFLRTPTGSRLETRYWPPTKPKRSGTAGLFDRVPIGFVVVVLISVAALILRYFLDMR